MDHRRLLSGGVLAVCAVFAALALFAAPVLGGKGGFSVRSFSPQGEVENAAEIADHLKDKRTVVLNLEQTNKDIARRLVDFLSGVAYANEGKIKKVANSTYIITPYNVDIMGDLIDELESSGMYF